jgi:hypothetical protein
MAAASREVEYVQEFNGGLNLTDQTQKVEANQSPDCLNVDFGLRGGVALRGGFRAQDQNLAMVGARIIGSYYTTSEGVLLQAADGGMWDWDGAALTDTTETVTDNSAERVRSVSVDNVIYMANGRSAGNLIMQKWDGTTLSTLTNVIDQTDYLNPAGTDMPLARHIATHNNFMFVADTVESATRYPNRIRFSHLGFPESWAPDDFFPVGGSNDDDPITGLLPFGDMLLIFKSYSVWGLYGYDRDSWVLERINDASGTCTCGAMAANSGVAYWFSTDGMLMAFNGSGIAVLSQPLEYWSQIGKIKHGGSHRLMWHDNRLWLSLEAGTGESVARWLFLWNPAVSAFTRYDVQVSDLFAWKRFQQDQDALFLFKDDFNLYRYDAAWTTDQGVRAEDFLLDDMGDYLLDDVGEPLWVDGADAPRPISGYYRTAWITAGETATRKRWKRPRVTAAADASATITVDVYHDFNDRAPNRSSDFRIESSSGSKWGTMVWGDPWSSGADEYYEFTRLPSSGSAFAVSYKFSSSDNNGRWWVDSFAVPYRRKVVR